MKPIRVLVVDDSAFARKVLRQALAGHGGIEVVGTAHDGLDALERIAEHAPDVVTLDLVMPNLDGIGVLQALSKLELPNPPRVVVVTMSEAEGDLAHAALRAGAIELVRKPTALANNRLYEIESELTRAVEAAAAVRVGPRATEPALAPRALPSAFTLSHYGAVAIGASTGGPQAVSQLLQVLPRDFPLPIVVVVHLPEGFSQSFAEHLDRDCAIQVVEAAPGRAIAAGQAMVARAGTHLTFRRTDHELRAVLGGSPAHGVHRPSLDVTFASLAEVSEKPVLGVVLTGMGRDGVEGARAIRARGGAVLVESESSSVVYGMPRAVWEEGLSVGRFDLANLADEVLARL